MGKTEQTITVKKCDRCGKEFRGDYDEFINCAPTFYMDIVNCAVIKIKWRAPYATTDGILCDDCTVIALKDAIGKIEYKRIE